ncbi:hypothetical protein CH330_05680 [candidate division WOR-3 bacterium JGI_Cruoil_03_51_56]|uniref:AAA+ ATPase domain-containing protein n=1 Tax=candidate division WOR-3 bacterium JGI_Cruoil_03_51_56 TaxID=1973747 RepID=A0A235BSI7_UNCW3|nr:MAG: hypothetical protein CH330_05680 [candidate division WOR-3 bacterium JGI_Cruoil_03_51_56]
MNRKSDGSQPGLTGISAPGLGDITVSEHASLPLSNELLWFQRSIGQFVKGGIYLLAGQPGIGKTTLGLQIALDFGKQGILSVYVINEQSESDLAKRAQLLTSTWPSKLRSKALDFVKPDDDVYEMAYLPKFFSRQIVSKNGKYRGVQLVVVDSIQGQGLSAAATKQYRHIFEFCRSCKAEGITTLLVAHVTKKGEIAGPKDLEHNVDCVLYMRKAFVYRPLFVPKNRFGPAVLRAVPLKMDRKTTALQLSPHVEARSTVARTFLGRKPGSAEAQAAVALPTYGLRGQITAPGLPRKEIEQLLNCISQLPEMDDMAGLSYTIQCRLPGERRYRSVVGLPLAMALIASYLQREIPGHHLYIGELDLLRTVREVPDDLIEQLWDAIEAGEIQTPVRIFCPKESAPILREGISGATVVACEKLDDAVRLTWPDLIPKSSA